MLFPFMGEKKDVLTFLMSLLMLLIVFIGLDMLVFSTSGKLFLGEFALFLSFLFIAFIASFGVYFSSRWGFLLQSFLYALLLIDLLVLYYFIQVVDRVFFISVVIAAIGFIFSISSIHTRRHKKTHKAHKTAVSKKEMRTEFNPGKYVASKTGTTYHAPKCEWAK